MKRKYRLYLLCCLFLPHAGNAQHSLQALDAAFTREAECRLLAAEDRLPHTYDEFYYCVGDRYASRLSLTRDGEKQVLPDGSTVYRLGFRAEKAVFMDLSFERFHLPEGGYAYLYNPQTGEQLGPYLPENIQDSLGFSTGLLEGDRVVLLCHLPAGTDSAADVRLHCVIAGQKAFFNTDETPPCLINTACSEADPYRDIVQSVVLLYMEGYLCSGTLVNNSAQDATPYILSAAHCMENIGNPHYGSWKFYFNIASRSCTSNNDGPQLYDRDLQVLTGCQLVAKGNNSDFMLLKLNQKIPESFRAYFSGWDRRNSPPQKGVAGIHHPMGDYKKISLSSQVPTTDDCESIGYPRQAFWTFFWTQGMAFQGSSGSGLFNRESKRLIGTLTAINNVGCTTSVDRRLNWYGKLSYHWFANNEDNEKEQLRPWLDPTRSGVLYLDGAYLRQTAVKEAAGRRPQCSLHPNPASDCILLKSGGNDIRQAELLTAGGALIRRMQLTEEETRLRVDDLPQGIYLLRVSGPQYVRCLKFTVIRP